VKADQQDPEHRSTGSDLRTALSGIAPPDEDFASNIAAGLALVNSKVPDPRADA
jgi:hypothetical protein